MTSGKIRGAALQAFARWYGRQHGQERLAGCLDGLTPEERRRFDAARSDLGVRANRWYPAPVVHHVLEGFVRDLDPEAREELVRRASRAVIQASLTGFLGFLFRLFVTPAACRMLSQQHWSFHYDSGRVRVRGVGSRAQRMEVRGWRSHHPLLCQLTAASGVPILEAVGCRGVRSRIEACVDRGDPCCVYWTEWR